MLGNPGSDIWWRDWKRRDAAIIYQAGGGSMQWSMLHACRRVGVGGKGLRFIEKRGWVVGLLRIDGMRAGKRGEDVMGEVFVEKKNSFFFHG